MGNNFILAVSLVLNSLFYCSPLSWSYRPELYLVLTNWQICPGYQRNDIHSTSKSMCISECFKRKNPNCRGICFDRAKSVCELYSLMDLGENSKTLDWISVKNLKIKRPFTEAHEECEKLNFHLVLPQTEEEVRQMNDLAQGSFHIDLTDMDQEGNFTTFKEGKMPDRTFFHPGKPYNGTDQDCLRGYGSNGFWDDSSCKELRIVMCQSPQALTCEMGGLFEAPSDLLSQKSCFLKFLK